MNFLVGIYNFSAILGIGILLLLLAGTIHTYNNTKQPQRKRHFIIAMVIEVLLILFLLYMLIYASAKTKKILGGLDLVSALT